MNMKPDRDFSTGKGNAFRVEEWDWFAGYVLRRVTDVVRHRLEYEFETPHRPFTLTSDLFEEMLRLLAKGGEMVESPREAQAEKTSRLSHKITQEVSVLENPFFAYDGRRHTSLHCQYVNAEGTQVTGRADVESMLAAGGIKPKPGDTLVITAEVRSGG